MMAGYLLLINKAVRGHGRGVRRAMETLFVTFISTIRGDREFILSDEDYSDDVLTFPLLEHTNSEENPNIKNN
jgi:hypothetical protein